MSKFQQMIKGDLPVLVDFYADWCGPCQTMAPILQEVAGDMKGKLKVVKVNVDKNQAAAHKFQIRSIPTLILFEGGKIRWKQAGLVPKRQLKEILNKHLPN